MRHATDSVIAVDSGRVGIEPISDVDGAPHANFGVVVEFTEVFECWRARGFVHFGGVVVGRTSEDD